MPSKANELTILVRLKDLATQGLSRFRKAGLSTVKAVFNGFNRLKKMLFNVKTAVVGLAAAFVAGRVANGILNIAKNVDHLGKSAKTFGVTIESLSRLGFVARLTGSNMGDLETGIRRLNRAAADAVDGNKKMQTAFSKLGINAQDLLQGNTDLVDIFQQMSRGMQNIPSQSERVQVAFALLGRSGTNLINLLQQSPEAFAEAVRQADIFGATVTKEGFQKMAKFMDTLLRFKTVIGSIFRELGITLLDKVQPKLEGLARFVAQNKEKVIAFLKEVGSFIFEVIKQIIFTLGDLFKFIRESIDLINNRQSPIEKMEEDVKRLQGLLKHVRRQLDFGVQNKSLEQSLKAQAVMLEFALARDEKRLEKMRAQNDVAGRFATLVGMGQEALQGFTFAAGRAADAVQEVDDNVNQIPTFFDKVITGIEAGYDSFIKRINDAASFGNQAIQTIGDQIVNGLSTALTDAELRVHSLKEAFKEFGRNTLRILIELINKMLTLRLLSAGLGIFSSSSISNVPTGTPGAVPGPPTSGAGPKLGLATSGGGFGSPPTALQRGGGGGNNITINISAVDGDSVKRMLIREKRTITDIFEGSLNRRRNLRQAVSR